MVRACLLLTLCAAGAAYGMDPGRAMSQYIRDAWGPDQGFPRGPVYAITQTPDGYLWIGAEAGLIRFDGWSFVLVTDPTRRLQITNVLALEPAADGGLWVRTQATPLLHYRDGVFTSVGTAESSATITAMSRTARGELMVAKAGQAFAYRNGAFSILAPGSSLPRSPVLSLAQTPDRDLWMGTRDAGLFRMAGDTVTSIRSGLPDSKVNCLLPDGNHGLWIGTDDGIVRWDGAALTSAGLPPDAPRFQALSMIRDRDGNLWVGTDARGLLRVNAAGVASLDDAGKGARPAVTAVFEDREDNLWTASASRLERLRDSPFVSYSTPEGLPADGAIPIYVDPGNRLWFPPVTGGLWWVRNGRHGSIAQAGLPRDIVYSIAGRADELWLGRQRGGLTRLHWESPGPENSLRAETYTTANGLAQNSVYSVYEARDGTVWAGTLSGGVSRFKDGKFTTFTIMQGLASDTVASILQTSDGTMWFATPNGLSALDGDRWTSYAGRDGLPSDNVNCLYEDSADVLWAGTAAGLAFRRSGSFQALTGVPPSLREEILGLAEDRYGSLWISTSNHVLRVNRDKLMQGSLTPADIREFTVADGLRSTEGVKRQQSVVADSLGQIWFSLIRGISVVDPARVNRNEQPTTVSIESVAADNTALAMGPAMRIPAGVQRVTLDYVGLSLGIPDRVRYRFKLDGFDRNWVGPVERRQAIFTNLAPGHYRFHVEASTGPDSTASRETVLDFDLLPEFWQTWWLRAGIVVALAMLVLAMYRLRMHRITEGLHVRFEERLGERTRIAQELHDTLLQGFLSASMQLHVAVDGLPDDSPARPSLSHVQKLMSQVIDEGRNAVRGLRSSSASMNLEQAFARIPQELAVRDQAGFRVIVDGQPRRLHPAIRDEAYRIGREALVNAVRHSQAQNIEIEIDYSGGQLRTLVRDDGRGIDPQLLQSGREGHWGLTGMRERAERIGAKLRVWSSASAGTEVELSIPGHLAFESYAPRRPEKWLAWLRLNGPLQTPAPSNVDKSHTQEPAQAPTQGKDR